MRRTSLVKYFTDNLSIGYCQPTMIFRSSSTEKIPAMPKFSTSTFTTFGERKARRVDPRWIDFTLVPISTSTPATTSNHGLDFLMILHRHKNLHIDDYILHDNIFLLSVAGNFLLPFYVRLA